MKSIFQDFIKSVEKEVKHNHFNYSILRQSEWKNTYLLIIENNKFIVQIRKKVEFYEHVVEALDVWNKKKCKVNNLIYVEDKKDLIAYVFPYIEGTISKEILLENDYEGEKKLILSNIGKSVRELCNENTSGFGWLEAPFKGHFESWHEYLENIITNNKEILLNICTNKQIIKLYEFLDNNKSKLYKVNAKLLYVDINLGNIILSNNDIVIIDYDYLISGDPLWIPALFSVLYNDLAEKDSFISGFLGSDDYIDKDIFNLYKIINLIQLFSNINIEERERNRRKELLIKLINDYVN